MNEEEHFTLNIPDAYEHDIKSGGLDFLPSNFEYTKSNDITANNNNERVINFDNIGKIFYANHFRHSMIPHLQYRRNQSKASWKCWQLS